MTLNQTQVWTYLTGASAFLLILPHPLVIQLDWCHIGTGPLMDTELLALSLRGWFYGSLRGWFYGLFEDSLLELPAVLCPDVGRHLPADPVTVPVTPASGFPSQDRFLLGPSCWADRPLDL